LDYNANYLFVFVIGFHIAGTNIILWQGDLMPCTYKVNLSDIEDCVLAQFAREDNDEALVELISRYELFIKMRSSSAHFAGLEKEDLIQEGLIGLFSAIRSFSPQGGASFRTYAFLCIKRRMSSAIRSAYCRKHIPLNNYLSLDDESNLQAAALTNVINPEDMIVCREDIGTVKNVVENCLTTLERRILNMYVSGVSYAAMAKSFNVSIKTIDNSLQKIKKRLSLSLVG